MSIFGKSSKKKEEEYKTQEDRAKFHHQQGIEAFSKSKFKKAKKELKEAIKLDPDLSDAREVFEKAVIGEIVFAKIPKSLIIESLEECIELNPNTKAHALIARIYDLKKKPEEANQHYREHLQIHPDWEDYEAETIVEGEKIDLPIWILDDEIIKRIFIEDIPSWQLSPGMRPFRDWSDIRKSLGIRKKRQKKADDS